MTIPKRHATINVRGPIMIDRADVEATISRVAFCAFTFYPEKPTVEAGYTIAEDIDYCMAPLAGLDLVTGSRIRARVEELIADINADRLGFIDELYALAPEPE